jgi:hypothetical protein
MSRIFVGGREIEVQGGQISVEELRQAAGIPANRALIRQNYSGANTMLPRRGYIKVNPGDHIRDMPIAIRGFPVNMTVLEDHARALSCAYEVALDDDCRHLFVKDFNMPPGYNLSVIPILLEVPDDYPESPPGVGGSHLFLPRGLRYRGHKPRDFHEEVGPPEDSSEQWGWWCYERIDWDPCHDDLIAFFELLRADMTDPR